MTNKNVIYWYRLGIKVYKVEKNVSVLVKDIDLQNVEEELSFLKNSEVCLSLSDDVSYLFKNEIDNKEVIDSGFRNRLLTIVKADIPEDFSNFLWDYKIIETDGKKSVLVFAPIAQVQNKINELSKKLGIKFEVIEPESISLERDPDYIVGITKKNDLIGKDEDVLNITVDEKLPINYNIFWWVLIVVLSAALVGLIYFLFVLNLYKN